jgi:hypothetical protein
MNLSIPAKERPESMSALLFGKMSLLLLKLANGISDASQFTLMKGNVAVQRAVGRLWVVIKDTGLRGWR